MPFESVGGEMHRFKHGELHSGKGGPVVKDRQQAIAIALSEARKAGIPSRAPGREGPKGSHKSVFRGK